MAPVQSAVLFNAQIRNFCTTHVQALNPTGNCLLITVWCNTHQLVSYSERCRHCSLAATMLSHAYKLNSRVPCFTTVYSCDVLLNRLKEAITHVSIAFDCPSQPEAYLQSVVLDNIRGTFWCRVLQSAFKQWLMTFTTAWLQLGRPPHLMGSRPLCMETSKLQIFSSNPAQV